MKLEFPGLNVRVFARAIQFLSKIGDEIHFEVSDAIGLRINTVNSQKTAFASVTIEKEFFLSFESPDGDSSVCKVAVKSIQPVFRSLNFVGVEVCRFELDLDASKLNLNFKCAKQVNKYFSISILEYSKLVEPRQQVNYPNKLKGDFRLLSKISNHFHKSTQELLLEVSPSSITFSNYLDDPQGDRESIRTSYKFLMREFDHSDVRQEVKLGFAFSDFRAFINFVVQSELSLVMTFGDAGQPIQLTCKGTTGLYSANLLCATLIDESDLSSRDDAVDLRRTDTSSADFNFQTKPKKKRVPSVAPPVLVPEPESVASLPPEPPEQVFSNIQSETPSSGSPLMPIPAGMLRVGISEDVIFETESMENQPEPQPPRLNIFSRCFDETLKSQTMPNVLAEDSD